MKRTDRFAPDYGPVEDCQMCGRELEYDAWRHWWYCPGSDDDPGDPCHLEGLAVGQVTQEAVEGRAA